MIIIENNIDVICDLTHDVFGIDHVFTTFHFQFT